MGDIKSWFYHKVKEQ